MSAEKLNSEPRKDIDQVYGIKIGIPFKPYENVSRFYVEKKGDQIIPEVYTHWHFLRREVLLNDIRGYVDVISEDPVAIIGAAISRFPLEKPLGETMFGGTYRSQSDPEFEEEPCILRLSFIPRTPAEYTKLLDAFVNVGLGKEKYLLFWNVDRPLVEKNFKKLRDNEETIVAEKNLYNLKWLQGNSSSDESEADNNEGHEKELGRTTFIWLPPVLKKLRKIDLTFRTIYGNDNSDSPVEPVGPKRELSLTF